MQWVKKPLGRGASRPPRRFPRLRFCLRFCGISRYVRFFKNSKFGPRAKWRKTFLAISSYLLLFLSCWDSRLFFPISCFEPMRRGECSEMTDFIPAICSVKLSCKFELSPRCFCRLTFLAKDIGVTFRSLRTAREWPFD